MTESNPKRVEESSGAHSADETLAEFQTQLRILASTAARRWRTARLDAEQLVQETLLAANRHWSELAILSRGELRKYLHTTFERKLADAIDKMFAGKRDVRREVAFDALVGESSRCLGEMLPGSTPTPSAIVSQIEQLERLAKALDQLSVLERDALRLKYVEECTYPEIAQRLGITPKGAITAVRQGQDLLLEILGPPSGSSSR